MRSGNVIFAAMLAMAPLGAKGADLVVWWEQGFYPEEDKAVRETIAAFEQKTGKHVELVFHPQADLPEKVQAAIEAGQPPDFLFGLLIDANIDPWAYDDRLVDLTEAVGPLASMFDPDVLEASMLLNGRTGAARPVRAAVRPLHEPPPRLDEPARTGRLHPRGYPQGVGRVLVVLVRPGPAGRAPSDGAPGYLGCGPHHVGRQPRRHLDQFTQFKYAYDAYWGASADGRNRVADPTARDTDPAARASLIKALDGYTAVYRKGCTPPDATGWNDGRPTTTRRSSRRGSS